MPVTIYKSSAGSGKTFTLVHEYLRLLIHNPSEFRNILAITFTNKATAEMKSRIVSALSEISEGDFSRHGNKLVEDVFGSFIHSEAEREQYRAQTQKNAGYALHHILHSYSEFSVSTIDSFFQKILRNFTKELKLPMRYELEMDTEFALDEIVVQLMQEVGHDKELTQWLEDFTFSQVDEDKGWDITRSITELGKEIFKEEVWSSLNEEDDLMADVLEPDVPGPTATKELAALEAALQQRKQRYTQIKRLIAELWKLRKGFENTMEDFGKQAQELIAGYGLQSSDFKAGTLSFFDKWAERTFNEPGKTLLKIKDGNVEEWRAKTSGKREKIDQLVQQGGLQNLLTDAISYFETHLPAYRSATEVLKNMYVYGILHDLKDKLRDYRTDKSLMLISDTNNILRAVISGEDTPFIYEKVGIVYKHLLIDEFQDTSTHQWKNLLPLVSNALGNDHTVLIVGDVKQSIYRWRGGNLQLLLKDIAQDLKLFFTAQMEKELNDNYRSAQHIVLFNNAFFGKAPELLTLSLEQDMRKSQLQKAYATVKQGVKRSEEGYVTVSMFADDSSGDEDSSWKEQARAALLEKIYELESRQCPLRNMAVLVRSNAEGAELAQFLSAHHIRVVSSESLLLKNSVKVQLLIAVLHYLFNNGNSIAKTEILVNYLAIHKPDYPLDHAVFADHLHNNAPDALFTQLMPPNFDEIIQLLAKKPLFETVELLLQLLQLTQTPDAYVQRFQDLILEFSRSKSADVGHFLEWWQENKERDKTSIIVPEGENAVTIMTIHKAKGLEFPVVFVPYAEWSMKPNSSIVWTKTDKEPFNKLGAIPLQWNSKLENTLFAAEYTAEMLHAYLDNLNMLYVALTRPTEELHVFSKASKSMQQQTSLDRIHKVLYRTLSEFEFAPLFDTETLHFEYGQPVDWRNYRSKNAEDIVPLTTYLSHDYRKKITLRSDSERYFLLFDNAASVAIKLGQKIHSVLEKLINPDDVDKVIRKLQIQGLLTAADEAPIKNRLAQIFAKPQVQEWFDPQWEVLAERTLLYDNLRRIPDRIIVKNNQAIIIDYKTGKPEAKHHKQLNLYAQWLGAMGYEVIGKYLLYISETGSEVEEVS